MAFPSYQAFILPCHSYFGACEYIIVKTKHIIKNGMPINLDQFDDHTLPMLFFDKSFG